MGLRGPPLLLPLLLGAAACGGSGPPSGDSAEGPRLYVASGFTDEVWVLDPADGAVLERVDASNRPRAVDEPHGVAVSPDGSRWYVTLAHGEPQLRVHLRPGNRLVGALPLPLSGAARIGLSPDGEVAFIADYWRSGEGRPGRVARVETATLTLTHAPELCPAPHDARPDPTGRWLLVTCAFSDELLLLDAGTMRVRARVPVGGISPTPPPPPDSHGMVPPGVQAMPMNAAWSGDGSTAWATLMAADRVVAVDRDGTVLAHGGTGHHPVSLSPTPDGARLVVTNRGEGSLSLLRLPGLEEERRIPLPDAPHPNGLALSPDGTTAYVGYEGVVGEPGGVVAVEIPGGRIVWRTPVGAYVLGVAWGPTTGHAGAPGRQH